MNERKAKECFALLTGKNICTAILLNYEVIFTQKEDWSSVLRCRNLGHHVRRLAKGLILKYTIVSLHSDSDNPGVFLVLVHFTAALDSTLSKHLETASVFQGKSKTVQNELLNIMLGKKINKRVRF